NHRGHVDRCSQAAGTADSPHPHTRRAPRRRLRGALLVGVECWSVGQESVAVADRTEGVHHAVAVEAVELPVTLTGRGPGLVATLVEVVDRPRLRTRRGDRGAFQDRAHLLRREAEV